MITEGYITQIQIVTRYNDLVDVCVEFKLEGYYLYSVKREIMWPYFWRSIYIVEFRRDFIFDDDTSISEFIPHDIFGQL
jgi:hypothetical protein